MAIPVSHPIHRSQWEAPMADVLITSRINPVEHITIRSEKSFEAVRDALEATMPRLDTGIQDALRWNDRAYTEDFDAHGPKLSIFLVRDHGSLLAIFGGARKALQYEIGNPLTASKMTRYRLEATLYAPLRVTLFEDAEGRGVFEYDKPSCFFGQFGDERVAEMGRMLDEEIDAALRLAAG